MNEQQRQIEFWIFAIASRISIFMEGFLCVAFSVYIDSTETERKAKKKLFFMPNIDAEKRQFRVRRTSMHSLAFGRLN